MQNWPPAGCRRKKEKITQTKLRLLHKSEDNAEDVPAYTVHTHSIRDESPLHSRRREGWRRKGGSYHGNPSMSIPLPASRLEKPNNILAT